MAAYKKISELVADVAADVPGCPDPTIERIALEVCQQFCRETQVWKHNCDPICIRAGEMEYFVDGLPKGAKVEALISAVNDGSLLEPIEEYVFDYDKEMITLAQEPTEDVRNALELVVALKPYGDDPVIPTVMYNDFWTPLSYGIRSVLLTMEGQVWSNPAYGLHCARKYEYGMANCKMRESHGRMNVPLRAVCSQSYL